MLFSFVPSGTQLFILAHVLITASIFFGIFVAKFFEIEHAIGTTYSERILALRHEAENRSFFYEARHTGKTSLVKLAVWGQ